MSTRFRKVVNGQQFPHSPFAFLLTAQLDLINEMVGMKRKGKKYARTIRELCRRITLSICGLKFFFLYELIERNQAISLHCIQDH